MIDFHLLILIINKKRDLIDVIKYVSKDDDFEDTFILNIVQNENNELIVKQEDVPDLVKALLDKKQIVGKVSFNNYIMFDLISGNQFIVETDIDAYIFSVYFNATIMPSNIAEYIVVYGGISPNQIDITVSWKNFLIPEDVDSKFKELENNINSLKKVATAEANGLMSKEDKVKLDTKVATKEDITEERTAREEADRVLTNNLATEVKERTQAILLEAETRTNADVELSNKINAEQTDRANADKVLTDNLAKEVIDRTNAVNAEVTAREQADTAINGEIQGIKDKGTLHDLFLACGATYNQDTKMYQLNGLDLTFNEMLKSFIYTYPLLFSKKWIHSAELSDIRTNIKPFGLMAWGSFGIDMNQTFKGCINLEVVDMRLYKSPNYFATASIFDSVFAGCSKLRMVYGFDLSPITNKIYTKDVFRECSSLETIELFDLKVDISFKDSPLLTKESIVHLINHASPSSPITITLHPTAYAMATADPDIQAELEKQPNISLAEGEPTA